MRRILSRVLLTAIAFAPLLNAQDPNNTLASLRNLSHSGQVSQVIQSANSLLASGQLAPSDQAIALVYLGFAYQQRGDFTQAIADYEKALTVLDRDGRHPSQYAGTLATLATVYAQIGQIDTAKQVLLRSIHLLEKEKDHGSVAMVWCNLATISVDQNARSDAHKYMAHALAEQQLAANMAPEELAGLATTQGRITELDRDPRAAIENYQRALDIWKQTKQNQQQRIALVYVLLGRAYLQAGDIANSRESVARGLYMLQANSSCESRQCFAAQLLYSKVLDASGEHGQASALRKQAQAGLNTSPDQQSSHGQISIFALR